jgi:hypothetical protein
MRRNSSLALLFLIAVVFRAGAQEPAPLAVEFGVGFYDEEHKEDRTWRWMAGDGVVRLQNGRRAMLLKIAGRVPHLLSRQPTLTFKLNGDVLDEFKAPAGLFQKEYPIPAPQQGGADWTELRVHTDQTVNPTADSRPLGFQVYLLTWQPELRRQPVEFGAGFNGEEKHATASWRWMGADGLVKLWNSRQSMVLKLTAHAPDGTVAQGTTLTLKFNGAPLDAFLPPKDTFHKEYLIPAARHGPEKWSELRLEVDKTVVPKEANKKSGDARILGLKVFDVVWELETYEPPPPSSAPDATPRRQRWLIVSLSLMGVLLVLGALSAWWAKRRQTLAAPTARPRRELPSESPKRPARPKDG